MANLVGKLVVFALCWASTVAFSQLTALKAARLLEYRTKRSHAGRWQSPTAKLGAILFDCDGVLADTERDGHRIALNLAMKEKGLKVGNQDMKCDEKVKRNTESLIPALIDPFVFAAGIRRVTGNRKGSFEVVGILETPGMGSNGFEL